MKEIKLITLREGEALQEQGSPAAPSRRVFEAPRIEDGGDLPVITAGSVDLH